MSNIIIHDNRVNTPTPNASRSFMVNAGTDLAPVLEQAVRFVNNDFYGSVPYYNELHLLCHGLAQGLQLGSEFINHYNASVFSIVEGKFGCIYIHGCSAALIYPGGCNGVQMCSRIAQAARACVMASDHTQYVYNHSAFYATGSSSYFMPWNGRVATWLPNGRIGRVRNFPDPRIPQVN